jgi:hypothetical protein
MGLKEEPGRPLKLSPASIDSVRLVAERKGAAAGGCCAGEKPSAQCRPLACGDCGSDCGRPGRGTKPAGGSRAGSCCRGWPLNRAPAAKGRPRLERGVPGAEVCSEAGKVPWEPQLSSESEAVVPADSMSE